MVEGDKARSRWPVTRYRTRDRGGIESRKPATSDKWWPTSRGTAKKFHNMQRRRGNPWKRCDTGQMYLNKQSSAGSLWNAMPYGLACRSVKRTVMGKTYFKEWDPGKRALPQPQDYFRWRSKYFDDTWGVGKEDYFLLQATSYRGGCLSTKSRMAWGHAPVERGLYIVLTRSTNVSPIQETKSGHSERKEFARYLREQLVKEKAKRQVPTNIYN